MDPACLLRAAHAALQAGQARRALDIVDLVIQTRPDAAEHHELAGIAHARLGDLAAARAAFERAVRCAPGRADAHYNLAFVLAQSGETDDAVEANGTALYLAPDHAGAKALQQRLAGKLRDRMRTAPEGFAVVRSGEDPLRAPSQQWARLVCTICGGRNFVTARTCARCGSLLPETPPVIEME